MSHYMQCCFACDRIDPEKLLALLENERIDDAQVIVHAAKNAVEKGVDSTTILCRIKPMLLRILNAQAEEHAHAA